MSRLKVAQRGEDDVRTTGEVALTGVPTVRDAGGRLTSPASRASN